MIPAERTAPEKGEFLLNKASSLPAIFPQSFPQNAFLFTRPPLCRPLCHLILRIPLLRHASSEHFSPLFHQGPAPSPRFLKPPSLSATCSPEMLPFSRTYGERGLRPLRIRTHQQRLRPSGTVEGVRGESFPPAGPGQRPDCLPRRLSAPDCLPRRLSAPDCFPPAPACALCAPLSSGHESCLDGAAGLYRGQGDSDAGKT